MHELQINTDGGARSNPGPAGVGVYMQMGEWNMGIGRYIGDATNNTAEYQALIDALIILRDIELEYSSIKFCLDSELVVKQINGLYKVRDLNLQNMHKQVQNLLSNLKKPYKITHVPREQNKEADTLYNQALDEALSKNNK